MRWGVAGLLLPEACGLQFTYRKHKNVQNNTKAGDQLIQTNMLCEAGTPRLDDCPADLPNHHDTAPARRTTGPSRPPMQRAR